MDFFETVRKRRSIRKFTRDPVPESVIERALEAAVLAPNSSNTQTWDFYWVRTPEKKSRLVHACMNQSAARTAQELVVIVADYKQWRRSSPELIQFIESVKAPKLVQIYYRKLIPWLYTAGPFSVLAPFKWIANTAVGFFRPMARGPNTARGLQEVAIKSAALAAENFVLALTAQGFATCMMEGFDEWRVKRLLGLRCSARVVMVVGIGIEAERGTWGPQFRIGNEKVIHRV